MAIAPDVLKQHTCDTIAVPLHIVRYHDSVRTALMAEPQPQPQPQPQPEPEPEPEELLLLQRPLAVRTLCEHGFERHGGGGDGAMAARSYLTLGAADYTASFSHELLAPTDDDSSDVPSACHSAAFECSTKAVGGAFQPSAWRGSDPTKTRVSVIGLIEEALAKKSPASFRFLDLGCGDGEILEIIHSKLTVPWPNLWGVTAEELRGLFDAEQPGFEPALQDAFSSWRGWKGGSEKQWVESTIAGRERTLGRIAAEKQSRARTNLHHLAPAEWNDTNYVIHDIQQLGTHRGFQEAVARDGKFDLIVSAGVTQRPVAAGALRSSVRRVAGGGSSPSDRQPTAR